MPVRGHAQPTARRPGIDRAAPAGHPVGAPIAVPVAPSEAARVRAAYGLDRPFVLFAGTVEPRKNLGRLRRGLRPRSARSTPSW